MNTARILGYLGALGQAVITHHGGHPQPVVGENTSPPFGLTFAVFRMVSPILYGLLVPPVGKRQQLSRV